MTAAHAPEAPLGPALDARSSLSAGSPLPEDAELLPIARGALLVSPGHATFCAIPEPEVAAVRAALDARTPISALASHSPPLVDALVRHGFGGPPRGAKPTPPKVQLQLTNACNLACDFCCTNSGRARTGELSREGFFAIVDEVRAQLGAGTRVSILGGEPLLVRWALDLAEHVLDVGLGLSLYTNGVRLADPAIAARVARLIERGAEVRVSLAGPTRESCDAASDAPRFDAAVAGICALGALGTTPCVDLMLRPGDLDTMGESLPALRARLPAGTSISFGILFRGGREHGAHVFESRAALESALDRIAFEAGETIAAPTDAPLAERREGCSCTAGKHLHVRSDGALFSCFRMEEKLGDLAETPIAAALASIRARARPSHTLAACASCALRTLCGGGCRSDNALATGDGDAPACGPWRVRVLSELLAEDHPAALEWPAAHLLAEAQARGFEAPETLPARRRSLHLVE